MSNTRKDVKGLSVFFYILAAFDVIVIGLYALLLGNRGLLAKRFAEYNLTDEQLKICCWVIIVFEVISLIVKLILARDASKQAKGTYNGTTHIKLATFLLVINVIELALSIYGVVTKQGSWTSMPNEICTVIVLYYYRTKAKELRAGE